MSKSFKIVTEDKEPLPSQSIPKKVKGKKLETSFNILDELEIDPEKEDESFTISSDMYDYELVEFKNINNLLAYVCQKGFECKIRRNGKPWGLWSPEDGVTKF